MGKLGRPTKAASDKRGDDHSVLRPDRGRVFKGPVRWRKRQAKNVSEYARKKIIGR